MEKNNGKLRDFLDKKKKEKIYFYEVERSDENEIPQEIKLLIKKIISMRKQLIRWWEEKTENDKEKRFFRLPLSNNFFQNFLFFNNSHFYNDQKRDFLYSLNFEEDKIERGILGKSLNKLLLSDKDFSNVFYCSSLLSRNFKEEMKYFYIFLLCFQRSFINPKTKGVANNIFFYAPEIDFCYAINKKTKLMAETKEDTQNFMRLIFKSIIDSLIEKKSQYSLENMYLIQYDRLDNQTQENVEYIGISKIVSTILLDDKIRESLNKSLPFRKLKENQYVWSWVLEELIKGNPLYPIVLGHVSLSVKDKDRKISGNTIFYALSTDIALNEVSIIENKYLFTDDFFEKLSIIGGLPQRIKQIVGKLYAISNLVEEIFSNEEKNIAPELFSALRKKNKNAFVNIILKNIIGKKGKEIERMADYLFKNILNNENLWEYYAMAIIVGLLGGYKNG
ncbi:MAG TPA: hypothetical protein ENI51_03350 [Candidatus Atribacteria bacterium]|nr:hypothetical protein [Candidatus Atribacteria bacterium]